MEKVSLLPATFVSTEAKPIRLLALLALAKPAQPMADLVQSRFGSVGLMTALAS